MLYVAGVTFVQSLLLISFLNQIRLVCDRRSFKYRLLAHRRSIKHDQVVGDLVFCLFPCQKITYSYGHYPQEHVRELVSDP